MRPHLLNTLDACPNMLMVGCAEEGHAQGPGPMCVPQVFRPTSTAGSAIMAHAVLVRSAAVAAPV
jgi:hypothetical protein